MRMPMWFLMALVLGVLIGIYVCRPRAHVVPIVPAMASCNPKEVHVRKSRVTVFDLEAYHKLVHLSLSNHEMVAWTFDRDATIDSVIALFGSGSPFKRANFSFADSAAFSGMPLVPADTTVYRYTITAYPHGRAPVTVDPGIIVDM